MKPRLSYSKINTYQTCQRKYYYNYVKSIVPATRQLALEFGSAWHVAMEVWHKTRQLGATQDAFKAVYEDSTADAKRTRATAQRMLKLYAEKYTPEVYEIVLSEAEHTIEVSGYDYVARIDKVVRDGESLYGMEHKTTSSLGFQYVKGFKPNLQIAGYIKVLQKHVDPSISKMIIDAALVTVREPRDGERFLRFPETVYYSELHEFDQVVGQVGAEIEAKGEAYDNFIPNWGACNLYGECPYRQLCVAAPTTREKVAELHYQPKEDRNG